MREGRDWLGLVVLCAAAVLAGLLELLFVPLYLGSVLFPVSILAAVLGNALWPRLGHALVRSGAGAFLPLVAWLVPVLGLSLVGRPEGDVIVLGGNGQELTFYAVLLLGCLSGFVSAIVVTGPGTSRPG
jgi:hypothetical protein